MDLIAQMRVLFGKKETMREYRLTARGRQEAKIARAKRDTLLDYLYPKNQYTMEHLRSMFGSTIRRRILNLIKMGYVEEVQGGF